MKVAIFEPEPRVCGPMSWAYHLRDGIRENGHEADVVTFTRSGRPSTTWGAGNMRPGIRWWGKLPDVVAKMKDAGQVLDGYDRVIMTDARTVMQDKEATKGRGYLNPDSPDYLSIMRSTKTPFVFALHGNNYPPSEVPNVHHLVGLDTFLGKAVTHSPTSPNLSRHLWPDVDFIEAPLPYRMKTSPDSAAIPLIRDREVVGITGRYITTKGHHALGMVGASGRLPRNTDVQLWGACSLSLAASATYKTFEAMCLGKPMMLQGERYGVVKPGQRVETGGDVIRAYKWKVDEPTTGAVITYNGGYEDGFAVCGGINVHVDLTASEFSDGMEYSQFEAIDAGCMQVSVSSMWSNDFKGRALDPVPSWPGESKLVRNPGWKDTMDGIAEAVSEVLTLSSLQRREIAIYNRAVLHRKHSPAAVARVFLDALQ